MTHCKPGIRVSLLLTGNEIMAGDIVDSNSAFIAQQLITLGLTINKKISVGDEMSSLTDTINQLSKESDIVIMNGGLGATVDDLTAEAVANVTNARLQEHPLAIENIQQRYGSDFIKQNPEYLNHLRKQAVLPEGVEVIPNPVGLAVGFKIRYNNAIFYFTPGVPKEMEVMITDQILPDIQKGLKLKSTAITSKFQVVGLGESKMQQMITQTFPKDFWEKIDLGFRASIGIVEVKFTAAKEESLPVLAEAEHLFLKVAPAETISKGNSIQEYVINRLKEKNKKIIILDNCTSGLLFRSLDSVPEAHGILELGLQANSEELVNEWLKLSKGDCRTGNHPINAVLGSNSFNFKNTYILAVTSTANSQDSSKTIKIHWGEMGCLENRILVIDRDRDTLQHYVSVVALDMLRRYLLNLPTDNPFYFDELTKKELR